MILYSGKINSIHLKDYTFSEALRVHAEAYGEDHIVFIADSISMSCRALRDRIDSIAASLINDHGLEPGDRVSLVMGNSADWIPCFLGVIRAGGTVVVENPLLRGEEIIKHYEDLDIKLMLAGRISAQLKADLVCAFGGKMIEAEELYSDKPSAADIRMLDELESSLPERRGSINCFTSGSTTKPKVVMLSQESLTLNAYQTARRTEFQAEAELICVPLSHIMGLMCSIRNIINGGTFVLAENSIESIVETCRNYPVKVLLNVPMMIKMLTMHPEFESTVKPTIDYIVSGSTPVTPDEGRAIEAKYDARLVSAYGMTEASGLICMPSFDAPEDKRFTTVGDPLDGIDIRIGRISDDTAADLFCSAGELGEVLVAGDVLMNGYALENDSEEIIDGRGYLHTGDIGYLDEDGFLHLCGRKKNIIIKGGEKILPGEIEKCLTELESVGSAVVIGVPDERCGEEIAALVIPRRGCSVTLDDAREAVAKHCTRFKQPKYLLQYDSFPLTMVGKTDLTALKKDALAKLGIE